MRTLKLVLAYDGTRYAGWQRQPKDRTIQAVLEEALAPLDEGRTVRVTGAGRTDAGVHARGQVASCQVRSRLDVLSVQRALNARLPPDIRVLDVSDAAPDFHAQYSARGKIYVYRILDAPVADPFVSAFVWHVPQRLDVDAMRSALSPLCGSHDFKAFQATGTRVSSTVRTLAEASVDAFPWTGLFLDRAMLAAPARPRLEPADDQTPCPRGGRLVIFRFEGDGFLRHMVRSIVGTAVEVGLTRRGTGTMRELLETRSRRDAGPTAPAQGLVLEAVRYDGDMRARHARD